MKKISTALLFICLSTALFAQDFKKFRMGFKANPNVSWMKPTDKYPISDGALLKFGFGFNADIHFTENYAFGTGFYVNTTGGKLTYLQEERIDTVNYVSSLSRKFSTQYVEVPLTFKLRTNEIGYITYYGQFGVGLGVNIRANADDEVDYLFEKTTDSEGNDTWVKSDRDGYSDENLNISDDINLFRMSLIMSAGIEYNISGSTSILAGVTFNNGFTNVHSKVNAVKTDINDDPLFDGANGNPDTYKLKAISNFIELNVGILF